MSATRSEAGTPPTSLDVSGTPPIPFTRLVGVELRKSYDTRAGRWLVSVISALVVLTEVVVLWVTVAQDAHVAFGDFTAAAAFVTSILLPVLGIMVVTSEWGQRTAMVTFALEPRRPRVIAAKAMVGVLLTLATIAVALVAGLVCNLLYGAFQGHADWTFGWSGFFAFLLTQVFAMLGGFALATLFLNTPAAIVVFFVYKWALPGLIAIGSVFLSWFNDVAPWINFQAAQNELYDPPLTGDQWGQLVVSGMVWLVLPLVLGIVRVLRAEVK